MKPALASRMFDLPDEELGLFFKPVQLRVVGKLSRGEGLTPNEKRYLRGRLGTKLRILEKLTSRDRGRKDGLGAFFNKLGEYYITGYEALKHNGYGWYYIPKRVEVVNTRLEGSLVIDGRLAIFRRVKSIGRDRWATDGKTGIRYATNERILADAKRYGQDHLVRTWTSMLDMYGKVFVPKPNRYKTLLAKVKHYGEPEEYGV